MKTYIVTLCAMLALTTSVFAGELRGRITDLLGNPRAALAFRYKIVLRQPDTGVTHVYKKATDTTTAVDKVTNDAGGHFKIHLPDAGLPNSKEVTVEITPDDINLANVNVDSLLGSSDHNITVVMPKVKAKAAAAPDEVVTTYYGPRGNFHLIENGGTALYCVSGHLSPVLTQLEYVRRDERFFYFNEREGAFGENREWAFARNPRDMYRVCGQRCSGRFCGYSIWVMKGAQQKWQFFEWARHLVPANGNLPTGGDAPPDNVDIESAQ